MANPMPPAAVLKALLDGRVIPAHPLALTPERKLDERHQRALTRYYIAAGAGGVAVGVHTTQFEIRDPAHRLYEPVIELAAETADEFAATAGRTAIKVGGVIGKTPQAIAEAQFLRDRGYHLALLGLAALKEATVDQLINHCRAVAEIIPVMGFYLQPAVGGRLLPVEFWRRFAAIENVVAIKMAPFNRYQTFDVVRGVAESGRAGEIALYTGNDDSIIVDLLSTYRIAGTSQRIVGGLLGHWACWTRPAVRQLERCHVVAGSDDGIPQDLLVLANEVTDSNAAFFDVKNAFAGCIAGIHEVLRRQGLMAGRWCLNPREELSTGQMEEIDRVYASYPHLNDDDFVRENLEAWLR